MAKAIEPFYGLLGSKIREAREARKMTQAQLALSLTPPATRASIANVENGKQRVLVHALVQFARAIDVDIGQLIPSPEQSSPAPTPKEVELELQRKLGLPSPQLKKLVSAARPTNSKNRKKS